LPCNLLYLPFFSTNHFASSHLTLFLCISFVLPGLIFFLLLAYDCVIPPMEKAVVKTDIQIALPSGCYGRVAPRSGLAAKHFIDVGAGVIDEDYRGNVGVVLFNFGKESFEVKKGDRIAQLICERICYPELEEVQVLDDTERGEDGFGSTGKN
uniref:Deoxyuridine 5'-triphosphate nucleotidohydrolase n=1 Tax=Bubo bubo TaxID=30461 RepID=A0A8C0EPA9_BUBBB